MAARKSGPNSTASPKPGGPSPKEIAEAELALDKEAEKAEEEIEEADAIAAREEAERAAMLEAKMEAQAAKARRGPNSAAAAAERGSQLQALAALDPDEDELPDDVDELRELVAENRKQIRGLQLSNDQLLDDLARIEPRLARIDQLEAVNQRQAILSASRWRPVEGTQSGERVTAICPRRVLAGNTSGMNCRYVELPLCIGSWETLEDGTREFVITDPGPDAFLSEGAIGVKGDYYTLPK